MTAHVAEVRERLGYAAMNVQALLDGEDSPIYLEQAMDELAAALAILDGVAA